MSLHWISSNAKLITYPSNLDIDEIFWVKNIFWIIIVKPIKKHTLSS